MRRNNKKREGCLAEKFEETVMAGNARVKMRGYLRDLSLLFGFNNSTYSISCQSIERSTLSSFYFSVFYENLSHSGVLLRLRAVFLFRISNTLCYRVFLLVCAVRL